MGENSAPNQMVSPNESSYMLRMMYGNASTPGTNNEETKQDGQVFGSKNLAVPQTTTHAVGQAVQLPQGEQTTLSQ